MHPAGFDSKDSASYWSGGGIGFRTAHREARMLRPLFCCTLFLLASSPQQPTAAPSQPVAGPSPGAVAQAPATVVPADAARAVNPVKPTQESLARAKKTYGYDCALCHGASGDGKGD